MRKYRTIFDLVAIVCRRATIGHDGRAVRVLVCDLGHELCDGDLCLNSQDLMRSARVHTSLASLISTPI
jgi:hypothetical protein